MKNSLHEFSSRSRCDNSGFLEFPRLKRSPDSNTRRADDTGSRKTVLNNSIFTIIFNLLQFNVVLNLKSAKYDKSGIYYLTVLNAEDGNIVSKDRVIIDGDFSDDFGF